MKRYVQSCKELPVLHLVQITAHPHKCIVYRVEYHVEPCVLITYTACHKHPVTERTVCPVDNVKLSGVTIIQPKVITKLSLANDKVIVLCAVIAIEVHPH